MEEARTESLENHSDNEFEKVPYPVDEEVREVKGPTSKETLEGKGVTLSSPSGFGAQKSDVKIKKSNLESTDNVYEARDKTHSWIKALDPSVLDLIYWKEPKKTGIVFAVSLFILSMFAVFPLVTIVSYTSLLFLTIMFGYRIYGSVLCYIKKSKEPHPLKKYLDKEINIPAESVHKLADQLVINVTKVIDDVRKLFLVVRFLDSIKFGLLLWLMTFIGSWLSGITLIIIGDVILFTVPKFYQVYQKQIDEYLELANAKLEALLKLVQDKIQRKSK